MEYIREVKIIINGEEFNDIEEVLKQLELIGNDCGNNIEIYIDTNKTTYDEDFSSANSAIDYIESVILWVGE